MRLIEAIIQGLGRVIQAPSLILWLYCASVAVAAPLAWVMRTEIKESIGASRVNESLREGLDFDWETEFERDAHGMSTTFGPTVVGIYPVLGNLEKLFDGEIFKTDGTILFAGGLFLMAWAFLAGGIIRRYSDSGDLADDKANFIGNCAALFFPMVRVLVISLLFYWAIYHLLSDRLNDWLEDALRDETSEMKGMIATLGLYGLIAFILMLVMMVMDYAKITLALGNRRSAVVATWSGLNFVVRNPVLTIGLWLTLSLAGVLLVFLYSLVAPGPGQSSMVAIVGAFAIGQIYILARLFLKLWFLASQTALFEQSGSRSSLHEHV